MPGGYFMYFASPKSHAPTYGALFCAQVGGEMKYAFLKHYWAAINQGKPAPRVCSEERTKLTLNVDPGSFVEITETQHSGLWMQDYRRTG